MELRYQGAYGSLMRAVPLQTTHMKVSVLLNTDALQVREPARSPPTCEAVGSFCFSNSDGFESSDVGHVQAQRVCARWSGRYFTRACCMQVLDMRIIAYNEAMYLAKAGPLLKQGLLSSLAAARSSKSAKMITESDASIVFFRPVFPSGKL